MKIFLAFGLVLWLFLVVAGAKRGLRQLLQKYRASVPVVLVMFVRDCEEIIEGLVRDLLNWRQLNGLFFELVIVAADSRDASWLILEKLNYPYQEFILLTPQEYQQKNLAALKRELKAETLVYHLDGSQEYNQALNNLKNLLLKSTRGQMKKPSFS